MPMEYEFIGYLGEGYGFVLHDDNWGIIKLPG
jgi:hypothetical protein